MTKSHIQIYVRPKPSQSASPVVEVRPKDATVFFTVPVDHEGVRTCLQLSAAMPIAVCRMWSTTPKRVSPSGSMACSHQMLHKRMYLRRWLRRQY